MKIGRFVLFVTIIVSALALTTPVFATGQAEAESDGAYMRLGWWGNPTRDAKTEQAAARYMEQNPGIEIELETVGWGGYWDRINTQAAAGSLPDVMQHDYSQIYEWVNRGLLTDLSPYIQSGALDTSKIADSFLSGGCFNNGIYGISLGTNALTMIYNPAILAAAGIDEFDSTQWTWSEFADIAIKVYEETGVQTMPTVTGDPRHGLENMLIQVGQSIFAADGKSLGFTDSAVLREFFEVQLRILEAGAMLDPNVAYIRVTPEEEPIAKGDSWNDWIWSNQLVAQQAAMDSPLSMALMPKSASGNRPGTYLKPSMFFAVTAHSQDVDLAVDFVNFFVNDVDLNCEVLTAERGVPIPSNVREALADQVDEVNRRVFDYIALVGDNSSPIPLPDPDGGAEVVDLINRTTQEVMLGGISVDDAVERILTEGNQILSR